MFDSAIAAFFSAIATVYFGRCLKLPVLWHFGRQLCLL